MERPEFELGNEEVGPHHVTHAHLVTAAVGRSSDGRLVHKAWATWPFASPDDIQSSLRPNARVNARARAGLGAMSLQRGATLDYLEFGPALGGTLFPDESFSSEGKRAHAGTSAGRTGVIVMPAA
jgi:hypothetical protein